MTSAVAILNQKGGSGKTPVTINLAGALSALGKSVLVFDLDGQGDLTTGIGFDDAVFADSGSNIYTLLTGSGGDVRTSIRRAPNDHIDVVPGNIQIYLADKALFTVHNRERRLAPARMNFKNTRAITILLDQIEMLEDAFDVDISVIGIVPVAFVPDAYQKTVLEDLRQNMRDRLAPILRKRETLIEDAWQAGRSIFSYVPSNSYRAKAQRESQADYLRLAELVMARSNEG